MNFNEVYREQLENTELYNEPPINYRKTIENIIKIRKEKNIRQQDIADYLGITRVYYNRIESLKKGAVKKHLKSIAEFFNMDYSELVVYEGSFEAGYYECLTDYSPYILYDFLFYLYSLKRKAVGYDAGGSLYSFLQEMGYGIHLTEVGQSYNNIINEKTTNPNPFEYKDYICDDKFDEKTMRSDIKKYIIRKNFYSDSNNMVFKIRNADEDETVGYWSVDDFFQFEQVIKESIQGHIDTISRKQLSLFNKTENEEPVSETKEVEFDFSKIKEIIETTEKIKDSLNELEKTEPENANAKLAKKNIKLIEKLLIEIITSKYKEIITDESKQVCL